MVHSLVLNSVNALISIYLFILFAWWWHKFKKATTVYKATCVLMLGLSVQYSCIATCYFREVILAHDFSVVIDNWYIARSKYIVTFTLLWYAQHVTNKIRRKTFGTPQRRSTDHV